MPSFAHSFAPLARPRPHRTQALLAVHTLLPQLPFSQQVGITATPSPTGAHRTTHSIHTGLRSPRSRPTGSGKRRTTVPASHLSDHSSSPQRPCHLTRHVLHATGSTHPVGAARLLSPRATGPPPPDTPPVRLSAVGCFRLHPATMPARPRLSCPPSLIFVLLPSFSFSSPSCAALPTGHLSSLIPVAALCVASVVSARGPSRRAFVSQVCPV